MRFREKTLSSGTKILLGKDAKNNDELMKKFKGKKNIILHTSSPGSPFCVIESLKPTKKDIYEAGIFCASYSQDWKRNKKDISMDVFTGKDIRKRFWMKPGTWNVKSKKQKIKIKKSDIRKLERKNDTKPSSNRKKRNK